MLNTSIKSRMLFNLSMAYMFILYPFENTVCLNMTELKYNSVKQKKMRQRLSDHAHTNTRRHQQTYFGRPDLESWLTTWWLLITIIRSALVSLQTFKISLQ